MAISSSEQRSERTTREELRQRRTRDRRLVIRHRWYAGTVASVISAALVFGGVSNPAVADTAPAPAPTETSAATPAPDDTTPPAEESAPPAEESAPPAEESAPPAEESAPPTEESAPPAEESAPPTEESAPPTDEAATPTPEPIAPDDPNATTPDATEPLPDVGILTVPPAGPTTAVITVKVGSDRTGITGVTPLAGVVLLLNTGATAPSGTRPDGVAGTGDGWAKCTSDAQGDCSFVVPNTQAGPPAGANRDARYWVFQSSVPAGYYANPSLRTGPSGGAGVSTPYQFRTGTQLRAGTTYSSQNAGDFMLSSGNVPTASGGIWQQSRTNPTIPTSCGLDVALILDLSGSVQDAGAVPALKQAANTFVDSLQGTPSRMSLFSFSTGSPANGASTNYPDLTSVSTAAQGTAFKGRYQTWTATGSTNWDRGLGETAEANTPVNNFDVAVIITDGNPTVYNQPSEGPGGSTRLRETENGIFSANALKAGPAGSAPTRILAFGVGAGAAGAATALNLRAISGPTVYNGSNGAVADYYQTTDYAAVGTALRNLALGNCQGALTVTKQIVPNTAPENTIEGAVAAGAGWEFTSAIGTANVTTPTAVLTTTAGGTGTVTYPLDFAGGVTSGAITVTETQQTGFTLQQVSGQNAVCRNLNTTPATPVPVTNSGALGFTVQVPSNQAINCTVYNRAPSPEADITVIKNWVVNGVAYQNGAQPSDLSAQLSLTGPGDAAATPQGWGVTRTGYKVGDTATLSEEVTLVDPVMCTNSAVVTNVNGVSTTNQLGAAFPVLLSQVNNTVTITNTVFCRSALTLLKQVAGGTAAPTLWTLNAQSTDVPAPLAFSPGATGVTHDVTPNARYQLYETNGDPRYVQTDNRTNLQSNPLSTGSATCIRVNADGTPYPGSGFSDGINGGVNVPLGYRVACTFVNETASLTLLKNVVNDNGGSTAASAWDLTATPEPLTGLTATTVDGSETVVPASTFQVRPDHVYTLTESDVEGYQFSKLQQLVGDVWVDVVANPDPALYPQQDGSGNWQVTVAGLDSAVYRFVNDDVAPILTLVKTVTNNNGGTAPPTAWTLTATTPDGPNLTGATGTPAVTSQPVRAGVVYTIGESGPAAYEWTSLSCTGYPGTTQAAPTLTLQPGDNVTCTLNNDDILIPVTVAKADGAVEQLADGTWSIAYEVVVTNTSATLPTTYSLTDVPAFDSSFTVLTQGWQGNPDVTDVAIEGGGADTYTYVVTAEANKTPVDPTALECSPENGGGFFNTATVTFPGGQDIDTGCAVPAKPVVQKTALPSVQNTTTGEWTLSYELSVSNPTAIPLSYSLSDTAAALPAGVTGGAWAASDPVATGGGTFVRDAAWAGTGDLATGTLPVGATHTYTISRTVNVAVTVTDDALTCGSEVNVGGGVWNTATVTNGIAIDDSSDCAEIDRPTVEIEKTVTSTTQLVDGTWEIAYDIVVSNPDADLAAVYSLADTLTFGGDIVVDGASWTGPTAGDFAADGTATLATGRVIGANGEETYTVTAHATVDTDAWAGDTLTCDAGDPPAAGGFLNVATVTVNGTTIPADDCSEPALPTILKTGTGAVQDPDDASKWLVSYQVTVTPSGFSTFYDLSDIPGFAAGITLGAGTAQRTDIAGQPIVPITGNPIFVDVPLAASGPPHTYVITWEADITDAFDPAAGECGEDPEVGVGFYNSAVLTVGDIDIDDSTCIPVVDRVYPTITKTVTSTNQDPATGDWTITYSIAVNLAANTAGLGAEYDLVDELDFGGDIDVTEASWTGPGSAAGDFTLPAGTATLATDVTIGSGETDTYTVTVVAVVTEEAVDDGTTECDSQEGGGGGFLNTALLTSGGVETPVEVCSEPIFPTIAKTAVGEAIQDPDTGAWMIEYDITVAYPVTDIVPAPVLGYVLTDAPTLPAGVELDGDWTAAAADADTPTPDEATWDGVGTWTIATAAFDPAADGITEHVFTVSALVRVTGPPAGQPEVCDESEDSGIVVINTATVTSGGYTADDDACQVVQFDDVGIEKTTTDVVGGLVEADQEFSYVLTVTNHGTREATDLEVADPVPARLEVLGIVLPAGWANDNAPAFVGADNTVNVSAPTLGVGESVDITVNVRVIPLTPPPVEDLDADDPAPVAELPDAVLFNEACVTALLDGDPSNDCDDVTVEVKDIAAVVYTRCVNDAPLLGYSVVTSPSLAGEPIDFAWTPNTPGTEPASVDLTLASGDADEIRWPGTAFTPSGVSIDYPGWRPLQASDYVPGGGYYMPGTGVPMTPEEEALYVFNGLIVDPSEIDFGWRSEAGTTIVFTVNPSMTFTATYPPAVEGCGVARHSDVQIEKTASKERMAPGEAFTYTIVAENISDDSAAEGVVITDAIPANIRITDVSWVGEGDPDAFPNYSDCAVTGQAAGGYGGTLSCTLFGPLQPAGAGLGPSAAPVITLAAVSNPSTTSTMIDNVAVVDYHTFGDPEDSGRDTDNAVIYLSLLALTGSPLADGLIWSALIALLAGVLLMHVARRRRIVQGARG